MRKGVARCGASGIGHGGPLHVDWAGAPRRLSVTGSPLDKIGDVGTLRPFAAPVECRHVADGKRTTLSLRILTRDERAAGHLLVYVPFVIKETQAARRQSAPSACCGALRTRLSRDQAFALRLLACQLPGPADGLALLPRAPLRRLLVRPPALHFAKHAFALKLLFQGP